jgi:hypothetical protein
VAEPLGSEAREPADGVHDIVEVEDRDRTPGRMEATAELVRDRALARGDRPDDDDELGHLVSVAQVEREMRRVRWTSVSNGIR